MGMTSSYYLCECRFRCRGSPQRDFSCASTRQQSMIIEELRKSQMQKKYPNPKKSNSHKIVPINLHVMPIRRSDDGRTCNLDKEMKKQLRRVARDQKENNSLRHALTHPTIQKFLRDFMVAQSLESILNFYLDVIEIIALNRNCHSKDAGELWRKVSNKYILDNAPEPVPLNPMHREMIVGQLLRGKKQPKSGHCLMPFSSCDKVDKIDKRALQGLFLAQHDAFLMIKEDSWVLFCQSDVFSSLLRMKQVRTVLTLVRPPNQYCFADSFFSVVGSDIGRRHGSIGSEVSGDSRRSSLGSCRQGGLCSLNPCSNIINFKDTTERGRGDKSRERGSSNSGRRDSNSILDQFFQGIRTTKGCAKAARTPLCTPSTTPGSTAYSISDIKHILTPLYLTHSKDLDDDNDSKRGYMGGGVEQEFSHDINIVTEQLRITKKRDRIFSILTAKTLSRYNSCSYDDMAESSNVFEKASQ